MLLLSSCIYTFIQGAEKILSRLRDTVPKEDWEPILKLLLIQEPFEVDFISDQSVEMSLCFILLSFTQAHLKFGIILQKCYL